VGDEMRVAAVRARLFLATRQTANRQVLTLPLSATADVGFQEVELAGKLNPNQHAKTGLFVWSDIWIAADFRALARNVVDARAARQTLPGRRR